MPDDIGLRKRVRARAPHLQRPSTVAVVVPCFNYAQYLPEAVASVLLQEGVSVEVIIVDDASTDDSADVALRLARDDSRIRVLKHDVNRGPVQTFNDGLKMAAGEFIVRLDADDLLTPGSLRRSLDVLQCYPSVGLVYGHPIHFHGARPSNYRSKATTWTLWPGHDWVANICGSGFNVVTSPEVVMRSKVVELVGGQQPLAHTHDMEMWLRLASFSDVAHIEGADQAWHRDHSQSLSTGVDYFNDLLERFEAFETLFGGVAGSLPEISRLEEIARRTLASEALEYASHQYDRGRGNAARTDELLTFAAQAYPRYTSLKAYSALEQHRTASRLGGLNRLRSLARAARRRLRRERSYRYWSKWGTLS